MWFLKPKKKENKTLKIALIIAGCVALAAVVAVVVTKLIQKNAKKKALEGCDDIALGEGDVLDLEDEENVDILLEA
jgi:flagellar basal body-associated protein FliL